MVMMPELMQQLEGRLGTVTPKEPQAKDEQVDLTSDRVEQASQEDHVLLEKVLVKQRELQVKAEKMELECAQVVQVNQATLALLVGLRLCRGAGRGTGTRSRTSLSCWRRISEC